MVAHIKKRKGKLVSQTPDRRTAAGNADQRRTLETTLNDLNSTKGHAHDFREAAALKAR
jgi:hypothetical protein